MHPLAKIWLKSAALIVLTWGTDVIQAGSPPDQPSPTSRPASIVDVAEAIPGIALDIRYYGVHNFVGKPIPG
jgi:D-alanyl-D-alanine dipeptidase